MIDWKPIQKSLGVTADGIVGRGTLRAIFLRLGADSDRAGELALSANVHFPAYNLYENKDRLAHFLAQVAHESGGFRWMQEIWGPTAAQRGYEGRSDLGNTVPGDGKLFMGRGPIQLTGRANYRNFGQRLGVDFESHPEVVALPSVGLWVACEYWKQRGINALADMDDIIGVTKAINGGLNGLDDRKVKLALVRRILS